MIGANVFCLQDDTILRTGLHLLGTRDKCDRGLRVGRSDLYPALVAKCIVAYYTESHF